MQITRILSLADLHLVSGQPKTRSDHPYSNKKLEKIQKLLVEMNGDTKKYREYFNPDLKPSISLKSFLDFLPQVAKKVNESGVDCVVFAGDMCDVSRKPGRDTMIHEDTFAALRQFVELIRSPVFFLPGNADIFSRADFFNAVGRLSELNETGKDKLRSRFGINIALVFARNGNFAIKPDSCSIIGLNSVGVNNYELHRYENMGFLSKFMDSSNPKPIVLFTHHPPFRVLPPEVTDILGSGLPSQQWILTALNHYFSDKKQRTVVVSGHCHKAFDKGDAPVREICLSPMLRKLEGETGYNIGNILEIEEEEIKVSSLRI